MREKIGSEEGAFDVDNRKNPFEWFVSKLDDDGSFAERSNFGTVGSLKVACLLSKTALMWCRWYETDLGAGVYEKVKISAVVVNGEEFVVADHRVHFLRPACAFGDTNVHG